MTYLSQVALEIKKQKQDQSIFEKFIFENFENPELVISRRQTTQLFQRLGFS